MSLFRMKAAVLAGLLLALTPGAALAHGAADPQYGGTVATANDLSFELVSGADGATIYVSDHDQPYDATGLSGKLTVLSGTEKTEAPIAPIGENKLEAKGIAVPDGAKSVATLKTADGKTITVRFNVPSHDP